MESTAAAVSGTVAARAVTWTLVLQWARTTVQLLATVLAARLLSPRDVGLVALVLPIVLVAEVLRDFGISTAIAQANRMGQGELLGLFWVSVGLAVALVLLVGATSGFIATFYGSPAVAHLTRELAPIVLLNGLTAVPLGLLARQLRLRSIGLIELVAVTSGLICLITLATLHAGPRALVGQQLVTAFVRLLGVFTASRFVPGGTRAPVRHLLSFSSGILAFNLLNFAGRNADNVVVGRVLGPAALGQYSQAYALLLLPLQQINAPLQRVMIPVLSRLQFEPERFRRYFCAALMCSAYGSGLLFALGASVAQPLVQLALGSSWAEAGRLFTVLGLVGFSQALGYCGTWLWTATGRAGTQASWAVVTRPVIIACFPIGIIWGLTGLVTLYTVVSSVESLGALAFATRGSPVSLRDAYRVVARPLLLSVSVYTASLLAQGQTRTSSSLLQVLAGSAAAVAVVLTAAAASSGVRRDAASLRSLVGLVRRPTPYQA